MARSRKSRRVLARTYCLCWGRWGGGVPGALRSPTACPLPLSCLHVLITPALHLSLQSFHLPGVHAHSHAHPLPGCGPGQGVFHHLLSSPSLPLGGRNCPAHSCNHSSQGSARHRVRTQASGRTKPPESGLAIMGYPGKAHSLPHPPSHTLPLPIQLRETPTLAKEKGSPMGMSSSGRVSSAVVPEH